MQYGLSKSRVRQWPAFTPAHCTSASGGGVAASPVGSFTDAAKRFPCSAPEIPCLSQKIPCFTEQGILPQMINFTDVFNWLVTRQRAKSTISL
jgi:hypothetical protein